MSLNCDKISFLKDEMRYIAITYVPSKTDDALIQTPLLSLMPIIAHDSVPFPFSRAMQSLHSRS